MVSTMDSTTYTLSILSFKCVLSVINIFIFDNSDDSGLALYIYTKLRTEGKRLSP